MLKAIVTGGGTGGHIYPALAVAEAFKKLEPEAQIHFIGSSQGMEARIVPEAGLHFSGVTARKLYKAVSPGTLMAIFSLMKGYREASAYIRTFRPDVVVGTGGYVAAATVMAGARQGIPTVIVEENAAPGRTNLWLTRWAERICIAYPECAGEFPFAKTVMTGVPIRDHLVSSLSQNASRRALQLREDCFTLLVAGGSQGAQHLNTIVREAARRIEGPIQILHQVGPKNMENNIPFEDETRLYRPVPYLNSEEMPAAYRAADIILCRCGASTLAEITACGLPALMTPLPTAYADHQTANARSVERAGAGVLLPQTELTTIKLIEIVERLRREPETRRMLAEASKEFGRPNAARDIAQLALDIRYRNRDRG